MKKTTKIAVITAVALILTGIMAMAAAVGMTGCDMTAMNTVEYVTVTHEVKETFTGIEVVTASAQIILVPSEDGECRVVCHDREGVEYSAEVENNTLMVSLTKDNAANIFFGISIMEYPSVTVHLPQTEYDRAVLESTSGGIDVPDTLGFETARLSCTSGSVSYAARTEQGLQAETSSGGITVKNVTGGDVELSATSGSIHLSRTSADGVSLSSSSGAIRISEVSAGELDVNATSGSVNLEQVSADFVRLETSSGGVHLTGVLAGELTANTSSGSVDFDGCDADIIVIKTSSGSVKGTLLSPKEFDVDTSSGSINVPEDDSEGGSCTVSTSSGSVKISVEPQK